MADKMTAHELDDMNPVDLEAKLRESKEELFDLRFQAATGQLARPARIREVRREIARIKTLQGQRTREAEKA